MTKPFEDITYTNHTLKHIKTFPAPRWSRPPVNKTTITRQNVEPPPMAMPESNLKRAVNYLADYSGCGMWRLGAAEYLLNYGGKMIINSLTSMILDPRFYLSGLCAIKMQRQASNVQKEFVKFMRTFVRNKLETKLIYEVDDIVFAEDIPYYNRCRGAFDNKEIRQNIIEILEMCDEVVVASEYMRDYYKTKSNNKNVVYIPNYAPKMWFDRFYNEDEILKHYHKNKNRPRVLITGSGTHYDSTGQHGLKDDYSHVVQSIIDTRKDFKWVFMGGFPIPLKPFIDNGDVEFVPWAPLLQFSNHMYNQHPQVTMAALADNHFNRAKSWIKFTESSYLGIPFVGQDLNPYKDSYHKFVTGDEMIDQIKGIVKDEQKYIANCRKHRSFSEKQWLDDHLDSHMVIYTSPYGDVTRKTEAPLFAEQNSEQFK